jgi:CheY-like chemotaxis protein
MECIGMLAGGIAHDLNNILSPVLMSVELLKDTSTDARSQKLLQTIETNTQRGADLVRQILSFIRDTEGRRVGVKLTHLVKDVAKMALETFPRSIRVNFAAEPDLWPVSGDVTQLHRMILNLALNARDAMPDGGTLTLLVKNLTIDAAYAATSKSEKRPGPFVVLEVIDTGVGIAAEIRDCIFKPFFTTKGPNKGTGLGLATVQAIVRSHDGFVTVVSEPRRGTTFKIHLPADQNLIVETSSDTPYPQPRGHGELVLVVDDEYAIRAAMQQTLEAFGYRALVVADGAHAVAQYAQSPEEVAVVITDLDMPIMDGAATIYALRSINPLARIIAISSSGTNGEDPNAKDLAVATILYKPFTAGILLQKLRDVLDHSGGYAPQRDEALLLREGLLV